MKRHYFLLALLASLSLSGCDALDHFFDGEPTTQKEDDNKQQSTSSTEEKNDNESENPQSEDDPVTPVTPVTPTDPEDDDPVTPVTPVAPTNPEDDDPVTPVTPTNPEDDEPVTPVIPPEQQEESEEVKQYYKSISTTSTGSTLKTQLHNLIKITKAGWDYSELYEAYKTTDARPDGRHYWDIYADSTDYSFNDSRVNSSYKKEGDSLNREHIIPQSTFNEAKPMKSDPHHVLPSDGYVNNRRGSYPHGNVTGKVDYTSNDGCKLGTGTGNTKVFEPMDKYKGDIARIYFYYVTCYQDKMSSNTFSIFDRSAYPSIESPFLELYIKWHKEDPVSEKEIIRNNEIYKVQKNRNPFIDHEEYVTRIWGS